MAGSVTQETIPSMLTATKNALKRTIMHMFMRAGKVATCCMKIIEMLHPIVQKLGPTQDVMRAVFDALLLDADAIDLKETSACLTGPIGVDVTWL